MSTSMPVSPLLATATAARAGGIGGSDRREHAMLPVVMDGYQTEQSRSDISLSSLRLRLRLQVGRSLLYTYCTVL